MTQAAASSAHSAAASRRSSNVDAAPTRLRCGAAVVAMRNPSRASKVSAAGAVSAQPRVSGSDDTSATEACRRIPKSTRQPHAQLASRAAVKSGARECERPTAPRRDPVRQVRRQQIGRIHCSRCDARKAAAQPSASVTQARAPPPRAGTRKCQPAQPREPRRAAASSAPSHAAARQQERERLERPAYSPAPRKRRTETESAKHGFSMGPILYIGREPLRRQVHRVRLRRALIVGCLSGPQCARRCGLTAGGLLRTCVVPKLGYLCRTVRPDLLLLAARSADNIVAHTFCAVFHVNHSIFGTSARTS